MRRWALTLLVVPSLALAQADSLTTRLTAAIALHERGERARATRAFSQFIDIYNASAARLTSRELVAVAIACTYLGIDDPQLFKDALTAFDRAIAVDPRNIDARVRLAELFLGKYNSGDAKATLRDALAQDASYVPALVAEARRRDFDQEPGADSLLARALRADAEHVAARTLGARLRADVEDFAGANREIQRALRADPQAAEALAFGVALAVVTGDSSTAQTLRARFTSRYPRDARAHVATAELLARVRQYAQAASVARQGTTADPSSWAAHSTLGLNLLRLGEVADARRSLETAFAGDPYNVWVKNTLDLLDTYGEYDEITHGRFRFVIEKPESRLLSLYLGPLMDRAFDTFVRRYGFTPDGPVRVEVYRSHADFSVRTVGLAGLGALGVSFGNTIAFDSPAARDAGAFNWGSTAWHELAHTFTLGATDMRVPRWLSEGLSVYEERRARKGWGQGVTPAFLQAYASGRLVPASRLNDGFVRPEYPQQVLFSYYQASLVCELIAQEFGEKALLDMLQGYRAGQTTEQVIRNVLRMDLPALDRRFDAYMQERFGRTLAVLGDESPNVSQRMPSQALVARAAVQPRNYGVQLAVGRALMQRGDTAVSVAALERARALFPEYAGGDGPYPLLARALLARGDKLGASQLLLAMRDLGEFPHDAHELLGDLLLQTGDTARAAEAFEDAMFVNPYDIGRHETLAALYARLGNHAKAVRERLAVLALNPVDRAQAFYLLAVAQRDAGDVASARRSVLRALEEAPHFERAQELLLALRARGGGP
ncbi:MAG: tetratricopeptide repeat protein [Gemmatimonadaceae bacterium]